MPVEKFYQELNDKIRGGFDLMTLIEPRPRRDRALPGRIRSSRPGYRVPSGVSARGSRAGRAAW